MSHGTRTPYGTAVYVEEQVQLLSQPLKCNCNDVEMTMIKVSQPVYNLHIVGIYRSKLKVKTSHFIDALRHLHSNFINDPNLPVILLGDFNINLLENTSDKNSFQDTLLKKSNTYSLLINLQLTTKHKSITFIQMFLKE